MLSRSRSTSSRAVSRSQGFPQCKPPQSVGKSGSDRTQRVAEFTEPGLENIKSDEELRDKPLTIETSSSFGQVSHSAASKKFSARPVHEASKRAPSGETSSVAVLIVRLETGRCRRFELFTTRGASRRSMVLYFENREVSAMRLEPKKTKKGARKHTSPSQGQPKSAAGIIFNPTLVLPTGSGKSLIIAEAVGKVIECGKRALVLHHNAELISQNSAAYARQFPTSEFGINCAGLGRRETDQDVVFCSIQSVYQKAAEFGARAAIFVDECHLINPLDETMFAKFLADMKRLAGSRVIGLTAKLRIE